MESFRFETVVKEKQNQRRKTQISSHGEVKLLAPMWVRPAQGWVRLSWYRPRAGTSFLFPKTVFTFCSNSTTLKCLLQRKLRGKWTKPQIHPTIWHHLQVKVWPDQSRSLYRCVQLKVQLSCVVFTLSMTRFALIQPDSVLNASLFLHITDCYLILTLSLLEPPKGG